jgi:hypothetical protein
MNSKDAYLAKVLALAKPQPELQDRLSEIKRILGSAEETERLKDIVESFLIDTSEGCEGITALTPLEHVHKVLTSEYKIKNWHYDRKAECLIINLRRGRHEHLSALLHQIYVNTDDTVVTAAEKFIDEGFGWFKSSLSSGRALCGKYVKFTPQEKAAFASVSFYE